MVAEDMLLFGVTPRGAVGVGGESELKRFTTLLDGLGVTYAMDYRPTREDWEWQLKEAGFDVDTRACLVVILGGTEYLFGTLGTARDTQHNLLTYGPREVFLMLRVTHRRVYGSRQCPDAFGHRMLHGFDALKMSYPKETWAD